MYGDQYFKLMCQSDDDFADLKTKTQTALLLKVPVTSISIRFANGSYTDDEALVGTDCCGYTKATAYVTVVVVVVPQSSGRSLTMLVCNLSKAVFIISVI